MSSGHSTWHFCSVGPKREGNMNVVALITELQTIDNV